MQIFYQRGDREIPHELRGKAWISANVLAHASVVS